MSVVRIIRVSALESYRLRLESWWGGLSLRERWLVGTLGIILTLLIVIFGIVKPLQAARAEALADIRTYETLAARVRAAGVLTPKGAKPQLRSGAPADTAGVAAQEAGLAVTFVPSASGLNATVAEAPYEGVVGWIADVERTTTLRVRRVELLKGSAPGRVNATVAFAP